MDPSPDWPQGEGRLAHCASEAEAVIRRLAESYGLPIVETLIQRLIVLLGRELSTLLERSLEPHGLSETDYRTLLTLQSQPGRIAHPGELCASVGRSPANMTRIADGLCERGLITRLPSDEDRRRTVLRITTAGEALVKTLTPQAVRRTAEIFAGIDSEARLELLEQLRTLVVGLDRCRRRTAGEHSLPAPSDGLAVGAAALQAPPSGRG